MSMSGAGTNEPSSISCEPAAGCLGIQESLTMWLDTPFSSKTKAMKVLPAMLDVQLPFPLEDCCYCFVQFRRKAGDAISALTIAARRSAIQQRLGQYQALGLDPVIIDHEGLALWQQSLSENPPVKDERRVIVSLEPDHSAFVTGVGSLYLSAHSLQITADSDADFQKMRRILFAELEAKEKVAWFFCGSLAGQPEKVNALHGLLSREWPGTFTIHSSPGTFLARALATRAVSGGRPGCNLRLDEMIHPAVVFRQRKQAARSFLLLFLLGLLLCLFNLTWQVIGSVRLNRIRADIAQVAQGLVPGHAVTYGREVVEAQQEMQKRMNDCAPLLNIFASPLSVRLARIVNAGQAARVAFTRLELSRENLAVRGMADDRDSCEQLGKQCENMGYKVEIEWKEPGPETKVRFDMKGTVRP